MHRTADKARFILWSHLVVAVLVAGGALAGAVMMRRAARRSDELTTSALHSITVAEHLQSDVLDLEGTSVQLLASDSTAEREASLAEIMRLRRDIAHSVIQYQDLVWFPGESEAWRDFQADYRRYLTALDDASLSADHTSRQALLQRWDEVGSFAHKLRGTADRLIAINMSANHRVTRDASMTYARALNWTLGLLGAALVLGVAAAFGAARIVRRQARIIDEQYARIEERNADLDAFAARIAHDLHGSMTPVLLLSQLLAKADGKAEKAHRIGEKIEAAVHRQSALVEELLTFSRAKVRAEGRAQVVEALNAASATVPSGQHLISARVDSPDLAVRIAPPLFESVLVNLLSNAIKYLGEQQRPRVEVNAHRERGEVVLEVRDNGVGMDPEVASHIFEPFYRAPGRKEPGLGLGLATVLRIIEAHGGRIKVASKLGEGTTFKMHLPAA